jgi:hypothetical protein
LGVFTSVGTGIRLNLSDVNGKNTVQGNDSVLTYNDLSGVKGFCFYAFGEIPFDRRLLKFPGI